jgi:hypothetical protein
VEFEPVVERLADDSEPFDVIAERERIATAADLMAQLDPFDPLSHPRPSGKGRLAQRFSGSAAGKTGCPPLLKALLDDSCRGSALPPVAKLVISKHSQMEPAEVTTNRFAQLSSGRISLDETE